MMFKIGILLLFFTAVLLTMVWLILRASETSGEHPVSHQPQQPVSQIRYLGGVYQQSLKDALEKIMPQMPASFHLDSVPFPAHGLDPYPVDAYCFKVHFTGSTVTKKELEKMRQHLNALIQNWLEKEKNYIFAASPYITLDELRCFYPLLAIGFSAISVSFMDNYVAFYILVLDNATSISLIQSRI